MVRPREFDRDVALERAMNVFWEKSYAAASTEDLLAAMGISRQSLYNAFGDKRRLYLEALQAYQTQMVAGHLKRLSAPSSPSEGVLRLLVGLIPKDDDLRAMGCMGICAIGEFGASDPEIAALGAKVGSLLSARLADRVREGQASGEFDRSMDPREAARFIQTMMSGIQIGARGGAGAEDLKRMARFAVNRLKAP
jgi:TetR/AcrR family transcriptional repressor of nem operon